VPAGLLAFAARAFALLPLDKPPLYTDQVACLFSPKSHDIESAFGPSVSPPGRSSRAWTSSSSSAGSPRLSFDEHSADY